MSAPGAPWRDARVPAREQRLEFAAHYPKFVVGYAGIAARKALTSFPAHAGNKVARTAFLMLVER